MVNACHFIQGLQRTDCINPRASLRSPAEKRECILGFLIQFNLDSLKFLEEETLERINTEETLEETLERINIEEKEEKK